MAISKRLRYEVLRRDGHACRYCGARAPHAVLTVDHVVPVALGGADTADNLAAACEDCNSGKSSTMPLAEQVAEVAARDAEWRATVAAAVERIAADEAHRRAELNRFENCWDAWTWTDSVGRKHSIAKAADWRSSVRLMLERGLDLDTLTQCVAIAMEANPDDEWSYFCGVAWRTLRRAQGEL